VSDKASSVFAKKKVKS